MTEKNVHQKKKIDAEEFAAALEKLPEAERYKIFYMIKGIELIKGNEDKEPVA